MLINCATWRRFYLIFIVIALISCGHKRQVYEKVAFHQSMQQELIVENNLPQTVVLMAETADGRLSLPSRASHKIQFRVYTVANIEQSTQGPWYEAMPSTKANALIETGKYAYFAAVDEDMAIRIKLPDGQLWEYRFFFGECWFDQPAGESRHTFNIEEEPMAGIPVEICP